MTNPNQENQSEIAAKLAEIGQEFYRRGWVMGTSGNFSSVLNREPVELLITASGMDKGRLTSDQFVLIDESRQVIAGAGRPSDESALHLTIVRECGAKAVLHTHSVWSTLLSNAFASDGGVKISGYEMLKGLAGVKTHQHEEWLPIIENAQEMAPLAVKLSETLRAWPQSHGFLLRGHGLYTWGQSINEARRHVEIFEFLLEVIGRSHFASR